MRILQTLAEVSTGRLNFFKIRQFHRANQDRWRLTRARPLPFLQPREPCYAHPPAWHLELKPHPSACGPSTPAYQTDATGYPAPPTHAPDQRMKPTGNPPPAG